MTRLYTGKISYLGNLSLQIAGLFTVRLWLDAVGSSFPTCFLYNPAPWYLHWQPLFYAVLPLCVVFHTERLRKWFCQLREKLYSARGKQTLRWTRDGRVLLSRLCVPRWFACQFIVSNTNALLQCWQAWKKMFPLTSLNYDENGNCIWQKL